MVGKKLYEGEVLAKSGKNMQECACIDRKGNGDISWVDTYVSRQVLYELIVSLSNKIYARLI